jgi:hypothetical protein
MTDDTTGTSGLSRRDLIKRGAIMGGVVWAAPAVTSMASPAFASSPPPNGCTDKYRFKIDYGMDSFDTPSSPSNGNQDCLPDDWANVPGTVGSDGSIPGASGKITVEWDYDGTDRCALITLPPGVILLDGDAKAGATQGGTSQCDDADPVVGSANQYKVCLSSRGISHIKGIVCVD